MSRQTHSARLDEHNPRIINEQQDDYTMERQEQERELNRKGNRMRRNILTTANGVGEQELAPTATITPDANTAVGQDSTPGAPVQLATTP